MRKFIAYISMKLGLSLALSWLVIFAFKQSFLQKSTTHSAYKMERFYEEQDLIKILGSSRAEGSFLINPLFEGLPAYNYGIVGTDNWLWQQLVVDSKHNGLKELIIINVDPDSLSKGSFFDPNFYIEVPHKTHLFSALREEQPRKLSSFPFNYYGRLIELTRTGIKEWFSPTAYTQQGTVIPTKQINEGFFWKREFKKEGQIAYRPEDIEQLKNIFEGSEDTYVFVKVPSYGERQDRNFFENISKEFQALPNTFFMDFSGTLQVKRLFVDHAHLSLEGAQEFSVLLSEEFKNQGIEPHKWVEMQSKKFNGNGISGISIQTKY